MNKEQIMAYLATEFKNDSFHFSFQLHMLLSGNHNKSMRQELMHDLTGIKMPVSKCGITALELQLKNRFTQTVLF